MIPSNRKFPGLSHRPLPTRRIRRAALALVIPILLSTCAAPTDAGPAAVTLQLFAPPSVVVHEQLLLTVRAVNGRGADVDLPEPPAWSTSDSTVARITPAGVLSGVARGDAVISVRTGALSATVAIRVRARLRIVTGLVVVAGAPPLTLGIGDSVQFTAQHVDANGVPIDDAPAATWASSNPAGVSVDGSGLVVGLQAWATAVVRASSADGVDSTQVRLRDAIAGQPATIRFAHAVRGAPPVTFISSKGDTVTLAFGESVQRPLLSGLLQVTMAWASGAHPGGQAYYHDYPMLVRGGDRPEVYAIQTPEGLNVGSPWISAWTWGNAAGISPGFARVRFIQSSPYLVFDVQPPGAPISATPWHCYFDPGDHTEYASLAAGDFDLILTDKFTTPERARIRASAPSGRAVTYVIIGDRGGTTELLAFPDP